MQKALIIAQKDILIRFYDKFGFIFLIITPLIITVIMGAVFGGGDDSANFRVPVAVVNYDQKADNVAQFNNAPANLEMGQVLVDILTSEGMGEILDTTIVTDEASARAAIDAGETYCCLIIIPPNFSQAMLNQEPASLTLYSDPARETSRQIVDSILRQLTEQFRSGAAMFEISLSQLYASGILDDPATAETIATEMGAQLQNNAGALQNLITLETRNTSGDEVEFDPMTFLAPSMAIMFLAFGASQGIRSILTEEQMGTFSRLNASPVSANSILQGKLFGTFFNSAFQFGILIVASTLLFNLSWGDPLAVFVLSIFLILAFTSLGLVIAVIAKDENQANTIGTVVLIVFMVIGGNLTLPTEFPEWLQTFSKLTPNYWGVTGFLKMGLGQSLADLGPQIVALAVMSLIYFVLGIIFYKRRVTV